MGLFKRLFIVLLTVIVLPTLVIMLINYNITKDYFENEVNFSNYQMLKQTTVATDSIINQTEKITDQISINNDVRTFFQDEMDLTIYEEFEVLDDINNLLLDFIGGTEHIEEISLYSLSNDLLLSTNKTEQPSKSVKTASHIKKMAISYPLKKWIEPNATGVFWEQFDGVQFVKFIYKNINELEGFIVIKLKNNDFNRLISEKYIQDRGVILIADQTGRIILNSNKGFHSIIDLNLDYEWFSKQENYKKVKINNQEFFISLVTSEYNQWKYISLVDTYELNKKMKLIRINTIILIVLFLVVAFFLALFMSKGIYNPINFIYNLLNGDQVKIKRNFFLLGENEFAGINKEINTLISELSIQRQLNENIENEFKSLIEKNEDVKDKIKKYFFYRLLKDENIEEIELKQNINNYHIAVEDLFLVILFDLDIDDKFISEQTEAYTELRQSLINDINGFFDEQELLAYYYELNNRLILILRPRDKEGISQEIQSIFNRIKTIQGNVQHKHNRTFTIVLSEVSDFGSLHIAYEKALQLLKYSLLLGNKEVIKELKIENGSELKPLPYDYRKYLNTSMRSFALQECKTIIFELEKVIKSDISHLNNFTFYYKDVLNTIFGFLYEIRYVEAGALEELSKNFSEFDKRFSNINDATHWIIQFMTNIFNFVNSSKVKEVNPTIALCVEIIEKEYKQDLSLSEISDRLGITVPYLSKLFKEELKVNFKEYLTLYKLEKAKQLFLQTDYSVLEIAERVGYNNSLQFTRMFKKYEHVTPSYYRNLNNK